MRSPIVAVALPLVTVVSCFLSFFLFQAETVCGLSLLELGSSVVYNAKIPYINLFIGSSLAIGSRAMG